MKEHEQSISSLTILPSKGGVFEVAVDGELVYSKKATGRHAERDEVEAIVRART